MTHHSTQEWAVKNFGTARLFNQKKTRLFNQKKTKRLVRIATRLSEAKGMSPIVCLYPSLIIRQDNGI